MCGLRMPFAKVSVGRGNMQSLRLGILDWALVTSHARTVTTRAGCFFFFPFSLFFACLCFVSSGIAQRDVNAMREQCQGRCLRLLHRPTRTCHRNSGIISSSSTSAVRPSTTMPNPRAGFLPAYGHSIDCLSSVDRLYVHSRLHPDEQCQDIRVTCQRLSIRRTRPHRILHMNPRFTGQNSGYWKLWMEEHLT